MKPKTIIIDDEKYVRESDVLKIPPNGNRKVVVIDRGWIFAGDVELQGDMYKLTRAVHVFCWDSIGYSRMLVDWRSDKVDIRQCEHDVEVPKGSVIFFSPVEDTWGLSD